MLVYILIEEGNVVTYRSPQVFSTPMRAFQKLKEIEKHYLDRGWDSDIQYTGGKDVMMLLTDTENILRNTFYIIEEKIQ